MTTSAPVVDWIAVHRRAWDRKPALRRIYRGWFARMRGACAPGLPIVELGCGPGLFKETYPEILATDVAPSPYAERVVDGAALPFADGSVANVILFDVFHHLPQPAEFLRQAARVLRPGGRIVLLEPWTGLAGRLLYRYLHHEDCDSGVDPAAPWSGAKNPMDGNAALPALYFGDGFLERLRLPIQVVSRQPFAALPWLLTGGFSGVSLLPVAAVPLADAVDRVLSLVPALTATRCLIVLERAGATVGEGR